MIVDSPAFMAKATASGTKANATVRLDKRWSLLRILFPDLRYVKLNTIIINII